MTCLNCGNHREKLNRVVAKPLFQRSAVKTIMECTQCGWMRVRRTLIDAPHVTPAPRGTHSTARTAAAA